MLGAELTPGGDQLAQIGWILALVNRRHDVLALVGLQLLQHIDFLFQVHQLFHELLILASTFILAKLIISIRRSCTCIGVAVFSLVRLVLGYSP